MYEALLIIIIIVLVVAIMKPEMYKCTTSCASDCARKYMRQPSPTVSVNLPKGPVTDQEHLTASQDTVDSASTVKSMTCDDQNIDASVAEWGPGMDFKDWVTSQSVDTQVIRNHSEFVKDRIKSTADNLTGRTYTPDRSIENNFQPWIGIRGRPQGLTGASMGNPTQTTQAAPDQFSAQGKFVWRSS